MARAALGWSIDKLAEAAGVGRFTVARFERSGVRPETLQPETVGKLRSALERAGVQFIASGKFAGGVVPPVG